MKRCQHIWRELIPRPIEVAEKDKLLVGFSLQLSRLDRYDRCELCGRIGFITKYGRKRSMISLGIDEPIIKRAEEFLAWLKPMLLTEQRS